MTSWQRLEAVIHYTKMTTNAFAKSLSLKRSENLYQIKRGNHGISKEMADIINAKYPEVNKYWLLTGEGNMFATADNTPPVSSPTVGLPFYDADLMNLTKNRRRIRPTYYINIPMVNDCEFAVQFHGNAMSPLIESGATVFTKSVNCDLVLWGQIYLVVTSSFAAIRILRSATEGADFIRLVPENSNYEEMTIAKTDIVNIYLVKGVYQSLI